MTHPFQADEALKMQQQQVIDIIDDRIANFHVIELVGRGAMASVYRAFDTELDRCEGCNGLHG